MQQATSPGANLTSKGGNSLPSAADQTRFVINLCASTTPVGLVQPSHAGLKRFTFFVSRRREEGRERFRLHMGYFDSQEEAERLLDLVREIYPAAWASVAPGQRLRARAAALGEGPVAAPRPAHDVARAAAPAAVLPPVASPAIASPAIATPSAAAVPPLAAPPTLVAVPYVPAIAPLATPPLPSAPPRRAAAPLPAAVPAAVPDATAAMNATPPSGSARAGATVRAAPSKALLDTAAVHSLSNIRAAIDSLRDQPAPPLAGEQVLSLLEGTPRQIPAAPLAVPPAAPAAPAPRAQAAVKATAKAASGTASGAPSAASGLAARAATRSAASPYSAPLPAAAPRAEVSLFAVQLLWSVQPIDMSQVPQLAIYSAYTLYGAEGNRDGRRWYGLRLGFFTDAVSAKQVAQYVRSEFSAVSVIPVSTRERDRASAATATLVPTPAAAKGSGHELSFIEDTSTQRTLGEAPPGAGAADVPKAAMDSTPAAVAAPAPAAGAAPRAASGKRAKLRVAQGTRPVPKRARHDGPLTLEETLEILGASTLQIDQGRGERLNHVGAPARGSAAPKPRSGSRIGRLMDRLAERFSGG